jgi:hypothetical protein
VPYIVGIGDIGKMDGADDLRRGRGLPQKPGNDHKHWNKEKAGEGLRKMVVGCPGLDVFQYATLWEAFLTNGN